MNSININFKLVIYISYVKFDKEISMKEDRHVKMKFKMVKFRLHASLLLMFLSLCNTWHILFTNQTSLHPIKKNLRSNYSKIRPEIIHCSPCIYI